MKRKRIAFLAALCLLSSLVPVQGFARETYRPTDTVYEYVENPLYGGTVKTVVKPARKTAPVLSAPVPECREIVPETAVQTAPMLGNDEYLTVEAARTQLQAALEAGKTETTVFCLTDRELAGDDLFAFAAALTDGILVPVSGGVETWSFSGSYYAYNEQGMGFVLERKLFYSPEAAAALLCAQDVLTVQEAVQIPVYQPDISAAVNELVSYMVPKALLTPEQNSALWDVRYAITGSSTATLYFTPAAICIGLAPAFQSRMNVDYAARREPVEISFTATTLTEQQLETVKWYMKQASQLVTEDRDCLWELTDQVISPAGEGLSSCKLCYTPANYCMTWESAAAELRRALVARESAPEVYFETAADNKTATELFEAALAHTGKPTEGDYLRWQYGGYTGSRGGYSSADKSFYHYIFENMTYYTNAEQELQVDAFVENFLQSDPMRDALTDYQRVQAIYGWLCGNVTYDNARLNQGISHTAYAAAIEKTAVCQGYATLFYRLALSCGIDARLIAGDGGGPHAWNAVKLGSKSYLADATWDAQKTPYQYFLRGSDHFPGHRPYVRETVGNYYYDDTYDYTRLGVSPTAYNNVRDLNGDNAVTVLDLQALFDYLSTGAVTACFANVDAFKEFADFADYNSDGTVNILDYQLLYALVRAGKTA